MIAMILAAGFGSRLKELTDKVPKPMIEVGGIPMIERVIRNLVEFGVKDFVVNIHYLAEVIVNHVSSLAKELDLNVNFSFEEELLGTGGGLFKAKKYFGDNEDILIHNSDVYSEVNIEKLFKTHKSLNSQATLAIIDRDTNRPLLFDSSMRLSGWENKVRGKGERFGEEANLKPFGFTGIHICNRSVLDYCLENIAELTDEFSIMTPYLRLAKDKRKVFGVDFSGTYWIDMGKPERLAELRKIFKPLEDMD